MAYAIQNAPGGHYRTKHVVKSEVLKMLTVRSTAITVGLTVVAGLLVTGLVANASLHPASGSYLGFDPTQTSLIGLIVAGLTGGVFGALLITGEYSSGTIRATIAATPKRPLLLVAKIGVAAVAAVVFCELLSFVSFFLGQAILSGGGAPSANLGTPGALRAVVMTGVFIALMALMSFGFGLIVRNSAAAIASFAGVVFVLPLVMHGISEPDLRYVPTNILTNSIMSTVNQGPGGIVQPLSPSVGLLLMAIYAAASLAVGAVLFVRRDA
ncbi:MAG TPA: ABC transporter permease subunit [Acidimicrobiales bacterium]|nr:ABC transporter permease subunit [Acidimicrobiales bacterium]